MIDHKNEFCEGTCLYAPLPRGWNMIAREWMPFEDSILKGNRRARRGQQRDHMKRCREHGVFRLYLPLYLSQAFLNVSLSVFHTLPLHSGFPHSSYLQENTWMHAAAVELNGLGMNLGDTLRHFKNQFGFIWMEVALSITFLPFPSSIANIIQIV